ncbi:RagB/SusD family nutrient uptake outer membrane protein [Sphingobacterium hotanense]|uniref:RagB/SusD family nutrient uptake outer membrane protein n=1 Tax=Sphingobacterium hotanense TaxID=649196 RepID=UPI0021A5C4C0|nr:RagB/SusD family nutrient uptake outer membrane protein [Sphingobacterium hotanense]MCT1524123.1 RagB/SusD family nutrient uptake outer membrane protein [Sphingobacterium hotanense]
MKKTQIIVLTFLITCMLCGCEKFIAEKSDKRLVVPVALKDFQALLSQSGILNTNFVSAGEVSSDDFYLTSADYNQQGFESDKRLYTWQPDYISRTLSSGGDEWYNTYRAIYYCNSVLQGLEENNLRGQEADNIKGQALVFRAARYLDGVQVWAPAYNETSAKTDMGMVLRLDPDMNTPSVRATVQETYDLIISDLTEAISLLPTMQPGVSLPTKAAAHGLLSRAYLFMGLYQESLEHANYALEYNSALIDFKSLDANANFPIPIVSTSSSIEIVFGNSMLYAEPLNFSVAKVPMDLYDLYDADDLRKEIFFRKNDDNTYTFRGTHTGSPALTCGISTSELYLITAECYCKLDNLDESANILNTFLVKRWRQDKFIPYSFVDNENALNTIFEERRKELLMRGLRWPDIKRLNRDGANITLTRNIDENTFTLPPNDLRYALTIPEDVISNNGITQNPR